MYHLCNTDPQPWDGVPRRGCRLALGAWADGPNGGVPASEPGRAVTPGVELRPAVAAVIIETA